MYQVQSLQLCSQKVGKQMLKCYKDKALLSSEEREVC